MALQFLDRAKCTTTTTGTGTYTFGAAATGFQSIANLTDTNTSYYTVTDGTDWEVGIGTKSGSTLARTTILASTNANAAVNWSAGTKDIFLDIPAYYFTNNPRSYLASVDFGASFTDRATLVVTGLTWVTASSNIVAQILTTNVDEAQLLGMSVTISDIVAGTGYTVTIYSNAEAKGVYSVMTIGV